MGKLRRFYNNHILRILRPNVAIPTIGVCSQCGKEDDGGNMAYNHIDGYTCWEHSDTIKELRRLNNG